MSYTFPKSGYECEAPCACQCMTDLDDEIGRLIVVLEKVKQTCLFVDDDDNIGITLDPSFPQELFSEICEALKREK